MLSSKVSYCNYRLTKLLLLDKISQLSHILPIRFDVCYAHISKWSEHSSVCLFSHLNCILIRLSVLCCQTSVVECFPFPSESARMNRFHLMIEWCLILIRVIKDNVIILTKQDRFSLMAFDKHWKRQQYAYSTVHQEMSLQRLSV